MNFSQVNGSRATPLSERRLRGGAIQINGPSRGKAEADASRGASHSVAGTNLWQRHSFPGALIKPEVVTNNPTGTSNGLVFRLSARYDAM